MKSAATKLKEQQFWVLFVGYLALVFFSRSWPLLHDAPVVFYPAWRVFHHGEAVYREVFDMNMPGTFLLYGAIGKITAFKAAGIYLVTGIIASGLALFSRWIRQIEASLLVLLVAVFTYVEPLAFLLQREFFITMGLCVALALSFKKNFAKYEQVSIAVLFSICFWIKPHSSLLFLPILLNLSGKTSRRQLLATFLAVFVAYSCVVLLWLASNNSLESWWWILKNYLPIYSTIGGDLQTREGIERVKYLLQHVVDFHGWHLLFPAAFIVVLLPINRQKADPIKRTVVVGLICSLIYPVFSGQFFPYHYLPAVMFSFLGLVFSQDGLMEKWSKVGGLALVIIVAGLALMIHKTSRRSFADSRSLTRTELFKLMSLEKASGRSIQFLDWSHAAAGSALEAGVKNVTSFNYDFHFYQSSKAPTILSLRQRFVEELTRSTPDTIVDLGGVLKVRPKGDVNFHEFPELAALLSDKYRLGEVGKEYVVYRKKSL